MSYYSERYPKLICENCTTGLILDSDGNRVSFRNKDCTGGFVSLHTLDDTTIEERNDPICYINGIKCIATEHRLGGIIIQIF
jgi:hypothetical protein